MAGRKNHSPEKIVRLLRRFDEVLDQGATVRTHAGKSVSVPLRITRAGKATTG
jgi:hypothetical protein